MRNKPMCRNLTDTTKYYKTNDGRLFPSMTCTSYAKCFSCGFTDRVSQKRREVLRKKDANGTLVDEALKARALAQLEKDLKSGVAYYGETSGGCGIRWRDTGRTVYR